jgi:hypothetical protein
VQVGCPQPPSTPLQQPVRPDQYTLSCAPVSGEAAERATGGGARVSGIHGAADSGAAAAGAVPGPGWGLEGGAKGCQHSAISSRQPIAARVARWISPANRQPAAGHWPLMPKRSTPQEYVFVPAKVKEVYLYHLLEVGPSGSLPTLFARLDRPAKRGRLLPPLRPKGWSRKALGLHCTCQHHIHVPKAPNTGSPQTAPQTYAPASRA